MGVEIPIEQVKIISEFKIKPIKKETEKKSLKQPVPKLKSVSETGMI